MFTGYYNVYYSEKQGVKAMKANCLCCGKKTEIINSVKVTRINVPQKLRRHFFSFFSIPRVVKIAKGYDIIHSGTYNGSVPAWLASIVKRKPWFLTYHEAMADWQGRAKYGFMSLVRLIENIIIKVKIIQIIKVKLL